MTENKTQPITLEEDVAYLKYRLKRLEGIAQNRYESNTTVNFFELFPETDVDNIYTDIYGTFDNLITRYLTPYRISNNISKYERVVVFALAKGIINSSDLDSTDKKEFINKAHQEIFRRIDNIPKSNLNVTLLLPNKKEMIIKAYRDFQKQEKIKNKPTVAPLSDEDCMKHFKDKCLSQITKAKPDDTRILGRLKAQINSTNLHPESKAKIFDICQSRLKGDKL